MGDKNVCDNCYKLCSFKKDKKKFPIPSVMSLRRYNSQSHSEYNKNCQNENTNDRKQFQPLVLLVHLTMW